VCRPFKLDLFGFHDTNLGCPYELFPPTVSFASVLNLRLLRRLPLHVRESIGTATFERHDVINDVALPPSRITRAPHESARAEELRLILPLLSRLATVDFLGTGDLRERVVFLGFDDVLFVRIETRMVATARSSGPRLSMAEQA